MLIPPLCLCPLGLSTYLSRHCTIRDNLRILGSETRKREISWGGVELVKILVHMNVCTYLHTSVNHSLTWAWKIIEGFKITAAASNIRYPQAAEGPRERVREETHLLHSCTVRSCSCTAAQPGECHCSCYWLHAPTQLLATDLGSDCLSCWELTSWGPS